MQRLVPLCFVQGQSVLLPLPAEKRCLLRPLGPAQECTPGCSRCFCVLPLPGPVLREMCRVVGFQSGGGHCLHVATATGRKAWPLILGGLGGGYAGLGQQSPNPQWLVRCPCGPSPGAAGTVVSTTLPQLPGRVQLRLQPLPSLWVSSQQGSHQPLKCLCRKSKNVPSLRLFTSIY